MPVAQSSADTVAASLLSAPPGQKTQGIDLSTDEHWQAVLRVLASENFAKSTRLSAFLSYVAERTLLGRQEEVTEQQIGVHVFGRPVNYNPGDDNIVRQTARQLRQRLALYYQEEGRSETIQILVPRGGYITQFQPSDALEAKYELPASSILHTDATATTLPELHALEAAENAAAAPIKQASTRWPIMWLYISVGVVLGVLLMLVTGKILQMRDSPATASDPLWNALVSSGQKPMIVVGDAGLNMYDNLARREVGLDEYIRQNYMHTPEAQTPPGYKWAPMADRRYIGITDLLLIQRLGQLQEFKNSPLDIRIARDIHFSDLGNSNAILIGGPNYNPWVHVFDKSIDFQMHYDGVQNILSISNRAPADGEMSTYAWSEGDPSRTGYAIISLTDNVQATGKVLILEWTTMSGVQTATDFLFNPELMGPIIKKAADGKYGIHNFDLLLETTFYTGGSLRGKPIALHIHNAEPIKK
jgi:hypothetical protein